MRDTVKQGPHLTWLAGGISPEMETPSPLQTAASEENPTETGNGYENYYDKIGEWNDELHCILIACHQKTFPANTSP